MDVLSQRIPRNSRSEWRFGSLLISLYITLFLAQMCHSVEPSHDNVTKRDLDNNLDSKNCHSCRSSKESLEKYISDVIGSLGNITSEDSLNKTVVYLEEAVEKLLDKAFSKKTYEIIDDGVAIKSVKNVNESKIERNDLDEVKGRDLFSKYTYEYRMYQKIKEFINTHILSINLPMAAKSFGLNRFLVPLLIGGQVLIKSILFAMFLPSILGSFGKILGKGISSLSAASSQASYPPVNTDDQTGYNTDNKDVMGYETNQAGTYAYPQDGMYDANDVNELGNVDMSRYGAEAQNAFLPSKNSYYKNQMAAAPNNYKVFQKIPASSMILSNYDPFYSPLLSRLDGIFARLGLAPSENAVDAAGMPVGGQTLSDAKLEACREQLICHMYASPGKYAPYSNLVSAQLSRELNELRRPVSDNPEILRFFRYMRAARRGQEGVDCFRAHPGCAATPAPAHTMFAAYHDINKLVTARKLH